jgi:hypothetical protein
MGRDIKHGPPCSCYAIRIAFAQYDATTVHVLTIPRLAFFMRGTPVQAAQDTGLEVGLVAAPNQGFCTRPDSIKVRIRIPNLAFAHSDPNPKPA